VISFEGQRLEQAELATFEVLLKLPKERIYRGYWRATATRSGTARAGSKAPIRAPSR